MLSLNYMTTVYTVYVALCHPRSSENSGIEKYISELKSRFPSTGSVQYLAVSWRL